MILSFRFTTMLVRPVATNKRAFYLMNTTQVRKRGTKLIDKKIVQPLIDH